MWLTGEAEEKKRGEMQRNNSTEFWKSIEVVTLRPRLESLLCFSNCNLGQST